MTIVEERIRGKNAREMRKILEEIPGKIALDNLPGVVADFESAIKLLEKIVEQKNQENK